MGGGWGESGSGDWRESGSGDWRESCTKNADGDAMAGEFILEVGEGRCLMVRDDIVVGSSAAGMGGGGISFDSVACVISSLRKEIERRGNGSDAPQTCRATRGTARAHPVKQSVRFAMHPPLVHLGRHLYLCLWSIDVHIVWAGVRRAQLVVKIGFVGGEGRRSPMRVIETGGFVHQRRRPFASAQSLARAPQTQVVNVKARVVHCISVVPLPTEDNLLVCLEITKRKDAKEHRAKNGVGSAAAAYETSFVACEARVKGEIERWAHEVNKWLWHTKCVRHRRAAGLEDCRGIFDEKHGLGEDIRFLWCAGEEKRCLMEELEEGVHGFGKDDLEKSWPEHHTTVMHLGIVPNNYSRQQYLSDESNLNTGSQQFAE
ncbi:hypothetical protein BD779DRAFT_1789670 [Infundibulicybe gibba]|nr:hypothetical protein BD779DRAFT_1789670 [Infundibulicybe gibba]